MLLLIISLILFGLRYFGVNIPVWLVSMPALILAGFSSWLFIKAEFEYLRNMRRAQKEAELQEQ